MANLGINTSTSAKAAQSDATTAMPLQDSSAFDYGDFVGSDEECEIEEVAEPLDRYYKGLQGLYYPIRIGQVLDQTYRIEHKLGHGGFSTVCAAYDMKNKRNLALKIIVPGNVGEMNSGCRTKSFRPCRIPPIFSYMRTPFTFKTTMVKK